MKRFVEMKRRGRFAKHRGCRAFSLLELVAVLAIAAILVALTAYGLGALGAQGLDTGGRLVNDELNYARESAITQGVSTVLVIRTSGAFAWQRLAVFTMTPGISPTTPGVTVWTWTQVSSWQNLPSRAFIDSTYNPATAETWTQPPLGLAQAQTVAAPSVAITDGPATLTLGTDYDCIGFLPSGALMGSSNIALRVVRARNINGQIVVDGGTATPTDWVKLIIQQITGEVKELYPGQ